jgi:hypothetical protein
MSHKSSLLENLVLLGFQPKAFNLNKESLFSPKRNIKAITEEILYFLFDQLGFASRFSNWPPVNKLSINEFKLVTFKVLEELKHSNEGFKDCPILIRKSLLDEYSGSASAERINDLFFYLSCVVVEKKFGKTIDTIIQESGKEPNLLLEELQNEFYQLNDTFSSLEPDWNEAIAGLQVKYEHFSQQKSDLTIEVFEKIRPFHGLDLEEQFNQKTLAIQALIESTKRLNGQMQMCMNENAPYVSHLQRIKCGEMDFSTRIIEEFFSEKFGKEFFRLSFQHKDFALDFAKIVEYVVKKNEQTLRGIESASFDELKQQSLQVFERIYPLEETIEKLSRLRDKLSAESEECSLQWSEMKKTKTFAFSFPLEFPQFDFNERKFDVEKELLSSRLINIPFAFESYKKPAETSPFIEIVKEIDTQRPKEAEPESEEDIDSKYIAIPRSPTFPSPKQMTTPRSTGKSRSLLKSVIKSQKGFKERLEMIKKKYQNVPNDSIQQHFLKKELSDEQITLNSPKDQNNTGKDLNSPTYLNNPLDEPYSTKELNSPQNKPDYIAIHQNSAFQKYNSPVSRKNSPNTLVNSFIAPQDYSIREFSPPDKQSQPLSPKRKTRQDEIYFPPSPSPKRNSIIEELFPTSPTKRTSLNFPSLRTRNSSASPKSLLEEPIPSFLND